MCISACHVVSLIQPPDGTKTLGVLYCTHGGFRRLWHVWLYCMFNVVNETKQNKMQEPKIYGFTTRVCGKNI